MPARAPFHFGEFLAKRLPFDLFLSIRARVILSYLLIVGFGLFYLVRQVTSDVRPRYLEVMEETMVDMANVMAAFAEGSLRDGRLDPGLFRAAFEAAGSRRFEARIYEVAKEKVEMRVYVTDATGRVIFDSDGGKAEGEDYSRRNDVYLTLRGKYGARSTRRDKADPTSSVLFVAAPIRHDGGIAGVVTVSKPLTSIALFMEQTRTRILFLGIASALGVALIGALFSAWLTYPIRNLIGYAKAVRDGRRAPLPYLGHSEIRTLGLAFEEMRDVIEGKDYVHRYVQTLTHEMKSPVAAIHGAAELLQEEMPVGERRRFLANIRMETARLQEGIDSLLLLASVESKKSLDRVLPVDLCAVAASAAQRISGRAGLKSIVVTRDFPGGDGSSGLAAGSPPTVPGDGFLLERALLNLLENAVDFTPPGGCLRLSVRREGRNRSVVVDDGGPGVPDYALGRVFERFYSLPRPDSGKKSSGLGLVFAREVALLHGGTLTLENRPEGGARATLTLPGSVE